MHYTALGLLAAFAGFTPVQEDAVRQPIYTILAGVGKRFELEILHKPTEVEAFLNRTGISAKAAPDVDVSSYASILTQEWSLYPKSLIEKTRLKRIILCSDLAWRGQKRTAIPDFSGDNLYLDVSRGRHNDAYVRKVIHHEFFHIVDLRDDGKLYQDPEWAALNSPGFRYGEGGAKLQNDRTVSVPDDSLAGVLNKYAASGVEEDKAETFCFLIVEPQTVDARLGTDSVLKSKVERLKQLLRQFCPEMDEKFWEAARNLRKTSEKK